MRASQATRIIFSRRIGRRVKLENLEKNPPSNNTTHFTPFDSRFGAKCLHPRERCFGSGTRPRRIGTLLLPALGLGRSIAFPFSTSPPDGVTPSAAADVVEDSYAAIPAAFELPNVLQPRVVIFDGVCNLCHTGVKWVICAFKHRKIKFCCLQSKAAEP